MRLPDVENSSGVSETIGFIIILGIVMAGIGLADGRARAALDAVDEHLATPHGIVLHQPAYTRYHTATTAGLVPT